MKPRTLFDKIWDSHLVVAETEESPAIISIDRHLIHEVTSPQAFEALRERGLTVRRADKTTATMDHSTPTISAYENGKLNVLNSAQQQLNALTNNCEKNGIELFSMGDRRRGIVHVTAPELGLTLPGSTMVCGDSHTSTHGAFGAYAFGIGTTEVQHVLATQCLLQRKPRSMEIVIEGAPQCGVMAKDIILATIAQIGVGGGTGHVVEYRGNAVETMTMEERMTICNMSIEAGARAGMIAPDDTTFAYLRGRDRSPDGSLWDKHLEYWKTLPTDRDAQFDQSVRVDAHALSPMVTWGTTPAMAISIDDRIPEPSDSTDQRALDYMAFSSGMSLEQFPIDLVFIGSCTNARISDLRAAATILNGRKIADNVECLVVPGSEAVKAAAEHEGLDRVFKEAGCSWREPGCSMCLGMNGDIAQRGQYVVSTSNRNFEGRQGNGARTLLASPLTAAASAVRGRVTDPREFVCQPVFANRD